MEQVPDNYDEYLMEDARQYRLEHSTKQARRRAWGEAEYCTLSTGINKEDN